jgi:SNF2 family DNA or RNA helicase
MRMRKAIYIPTNTPILVMEEVNEEYVKVFMDTQEQIVERKDIKSEEEEQLSSFAEIEKAILHSLVENPVSDLFYSYNTNKLVPEHHQYKPLVKMLKSPNNRLLIADEVGLGKTIEAGMIYKEIDKRNVVDIALFVVPSSLT